MKTVEKKNILLCVAGSTPQIITETLYDLTIQKGHRIDEIRVITTLDGRDRIIAGSSSSRPGGSAEESLLDKEKGQFFSFLRDYPQVGKIEFNETSITLLRTLDGRTLADIRTLEQNELAGDQICEIVRELCKDENVRIFASVAGGRKTMGIYLTAAMQLYGRADDTLSHVLVNEDFETNVKFFYPPPIPQTITLRDGRKISTDAAEIYLAEVPFIRLRGIGVRQSDEKPESYKQTVERAQSDLKLAETAYDLRFDLGGKRIILADREVKLPLRELFVYTMFAYFRKNHLGEAGFVNLNKINRKEIDLICRIISKAHGYERGFDDFDFLPRSDFIHKLDVEDVRDASEEKGPRISVAEARDKIVQTYREIFSRIWWEKLEPKGFPISFQIKSLGELGPQTYGLKLLPDRIVFE